MYICLVILFCLGITIKEMSNCTYLDKIKNKAVYQSKEIVKASGKSSEGGLLHSMELPFVASS